ncbi:MAG: orotidine-5'-phosphate decarboxylase [Patescibacteria group bacterium]
MFTFEGSCWLTPGEQREAILRLVNDGIIKWDNGRTLPLKSGGTTDTYINMRQMRDFPGLIGYLAGLYENPLRRLRVDRIVEVPDAVSPMAGVISVATGIPLVTIREEAKAGRVVKGKMIGTIKRGDRVAIIDDVVTDGASKLTPIAELRAAGAEIVAIIVLVDRQQGWKKKLAEAGYGDVGVWPAMTLHDVRKYLVTEGIMRRCDPGIEAKNPIIVALDGKSWDEVLPIIDRLRPSGCILKANDLLLEDGLERIIADLSVYGRVMADPKWCDIPNTLVNFCKRLRRMPPWAVTVHASGGSEMVKAAVDTLAGTPTIVLAVTVLTSLKDECEVITGRLPIDQVKVLAKVVYEAGARGFVCSTEEAAMLRGMYPDATIVTPGLRSPGKEAHEQKRVGTFAGAQEAGANYYVGGRQFFGAEDPVAEINRVIKEELKIEL